MNTSVDPHAPLNLSAFQPRYPQLHNCGRPSLPEQLWVLDEGDDTDSIDRSAVPLVAPVQLDDHHALPAFVVR